MFKANKKKSLEKDNKKKDCSIICDDLTPSILSKCDFLENEKSISIFSSQLKENKKSLISRKRMREDDSREDEFEQDTECINLDEYEKIISDFKDEFKSLGILNDNIKNIQVEHNLNDSLYLDLMREDSVQKSQNTNFNSLDIFPYQNKIFDNRLLLNQVLSTMLTDASHMIKHDSNRPSNIPNYIFLNANLEESPSLALNNESRKTLEKLKKKINSNMMSMSSLDKYKTDSSSVIRRIEQYTNIDLNECTLITLFNDINNLLNENCRFSKRINKIKNRPEDFEVDNLNWRNISYKTINKIKNNTDILLASNINFDKKERFTYQNILYNKLTQNFNNKINFENKEYETNLELFTNLIKDKELFKSAIYVGNKNSKNLFKYYNDEKYENTLQNAVLFINKINRNNLLKNLKFKKSKLLLNCYEEIEGQIDFNLYNYKNFKFEVKKIIKNFTICNNINKKTSSDEKKICFLLKFFLYMKMSNTSYYHFNEISSWKLFYDFYNKEVEYKKKLKRKDKGKDKNKEEILLYHKNKIEEKKKNKYFQIKKNSNVIKIDTSAFSSDVLLSNKLEKPKEEELLEINSNKFENPVTLNNLNINNQNFMSHIENNHRSSITNLNLNLNLNLNVNVNLQVTSPKQITETFKYQKEEKEINYFNLKYELNNENTNKKIGRPHTKSEEDKYLLINKIKDKAFSDNMKIKCSISDNLKAITQLSSNKGKNNNCILNSKPMHSNNNSSQNNIFNFSNPISLTTPFGQEKEPDDKHKANYSNIKIDLNKDKSEEKHLDKECISTNNAPKEEEEEIDLNRIITTESDDFHHQDCQTNILSNYFLINNFLDNKFIKNMNNINTKSAEIRTNANDIILDKDTEKIDKTLTSFSSSCKKNKNKNILIFNIKKVNRKEKGFSPTINKRKKSYNTNDNIKNSCNVNNNSNSESSYINKYPKIKNKNFHKETTLGTFCSNNSLNNNLISLNSFNMNENSNNISNSGTTGNIFIIDDNMKNNNNIVKLVSVNPPGLLLPNSNNQSQLRNDSNVSYLSKKSNQSALAESAKLRLTKTLRELKPVSNVNFEIRRTTIVNQNQVDVGDSINNIISIDNPFENHIYQHSTLNFLNSFSNEES